MKIKFKKLSEDATTPTRGSSYAAGWDLYSTHSAEIKGGTTELIHTGIAVEIPEGYFGAIYARSGLATKHGLAPANCVGIIDSDYRGEVIVALHNNNSPAKLEQIQVTEDAYKTGLQYNFSNVKEISKGERIAQLIIQKFEAISLIEVEELSDTDRGEGGFGSTGTK